MKIYRNKEMKISLKFYLVVDEELNFFLVGVFFCSAEYGYVFCYGCL